MLSFRVLSSFRAGPTLLAVHSGSLLSRHLHPSSVRSADKPPTAIASLNVEKRRIMADQGKTDEEKVKDVRTLLEKSNELDAEQKTKQLRRFRRQLKKAAEEASGRPKSPPSAYALFLQNCKATGVKTEARTKWKALSESEQEPFVKEAGPAVPSCVLYFSVSEEWKATQPPKTVSPYAKFVKAQYASIANDNMSAPDVMRELGRRWKLLSTTEKAAYGSPSSTVKSEQS